MSAKDPFEPSPVSEEMFLGVLREAVGALERVRVPALVMGGVASASLGRDRWTYDIDLFVFEKDARTALEALAEVGFRTQETYPDWLYKGIKREVLVDLIFRSRGEVVMDEEMVARARCEEFRGEPLRVLAPEDLLVTKVLAFTEETPRHWYDALGLIAAGGLDWTYLLRRCEGRERHVLSLLVYAQAEGLPVSDMAIRQLIARVYSPDDYLMARLQEAFAHDERTDELGIAASFGGGAVVLAGTVSTPQRREAVLAVAREVLDGRPLHDEILVADLSEPIGTEDLT
ncbi:MAG: nucleotidyltransferase [Egibacteraceae bacterium]